MGIEGEEGDVEGSELVAASGTAEVGSEFSEPGGPVDSLDEDVTAFPSDFPAVDDAALAADFGILILHHSYLRSVDGLDHRDRLPRKSCACCRRKDVSVLTR